MKQQHPSGGRVDAHRRKTFLEVDAVSPLLRARLRWAEWEALIEAVGIEIDRPLGSRHPHFPEIIYPIDYGYLPETTGTDGEGLDVFVGSALNGLVGAILTTDRRRGDQEVKLLYNCTRAEIYLVNGFINFDQRKMSGILVLRTQMDMVE